LFTQKVLILVSRPDPKITVPTSVTSLVSSYYGYILIWDNRFSSVLSTDRAFAASANLRVINVFIIIIIIIINRQATRQAKLIAKAALGDGRTDHDVNGETKSHTQPNRPTCTAQVR